ncbi:hypothetical protein OS175_00165 [Marinicella sp. S1101]|uniref:hypothetical protein n=1 Tax=Marinicella marina TaxID=2996016 RepID=UPI002260B671|nr:hypothetical protein [Marinicella marina]MCX7552275.1 hypothetical protein [Marinicella marina]MDJ1139151.1 hypothetical protein [Marinicella marina]
MVNRLTTILKEQMRLLLFHRIRPTLATDFYAYLIYVLIITWVVGMGRYWDSPSADWWQLLGLGSVLYMFFLSSLLFVLIWPLKPNNWSYQTVLIFVGLTSLPAILYAIPLEQYVPMEQAQSINAWALTLVASWRVALYGFFLHTVAGLEGLDWVVAMLLPLSAILVALSALNLEHAVFEIMAGNATSPETASDKAYFMVLFLSVFAYITLPITLIIYFYRIYVKCKKTA